VGPTGDIVSRIERKIEGGGARAADASEILASLARDRASRAAGRKDAVSRYFSAEDGWQEASTLLGGAFAPSIETGGGKADQ